jgi:hypothetical protein
MKELMNQDLKSITEADSTPMVSIYLSRDISLNMKTFNEKWKDALGKVEFYLLKDYTRSFVHTFLEPLKVAPFLETLDHLDKGVIIFFSPVIQGYIRVQSTMNDLVVVADSFHIKPLLRIKNNERGFFLVTMSSKMINVSVESNGHLYRMESIKNTVPEEDANTNKSKPDAKDFISHAAAELNKSFALYKMPIILAGVKDHLGHMKKYLNHGMILEDCIVGNVERMKTEELREKCFDLLEPYYRKKERESIEELNIAVKKNHAITYVEDIAVSAVYGKIKKLFVLENKQLWGTINKNTGEVFISPKQSNSHDDDILDDICQLVLAKGGEVVVLKEATDVKGFIAAAIVTDKSHLFDFNNSYTSP